MLALVWRQLSPRRGSETNLISVKGACRQLTSLPKREGPALTRLRTMNHRDPAPSGKFMTHTWLIKSSRGTRQIASSVLQSVRSREFIIICIA